MSSKSDKIFLGLYDFFGPINWYSTFPQGPLSEDLCKFGQFPWQQFPYNIISVNIFISAKNTVIATPKSHHKMPALIQQTTNVYLNFAPFIINRGCKTDIKRSVHIGFFSQCFLLSCLKPTINIVTFNLELQMCRKNLNLSTSPTLPSFNLSLQQF